MPQDVSISWDPPASDGGYPITSYDVSMGGVDAFGVTSSPHILLDVPDGTWYAQVVANNAAGASPGGYSVATQVGGNTNPFVGFGRDAFDAFTAPNTYTVTNLNDAGAGSLRDALTQTGPRKIDFSVSGDIVLTSSLTIPSDTWIDGSTAPNGGICVRIQDGAFEGRMLFVSGTDIILQHLRLRPGRGANTGVGVDAIGTGTGTARLVIDHCSVSFATDEIIDVWFDSTDVTISHCMLAYSCANTGTYSHTDNNNANGMLIGGSAGSIRPDRVTIYRCVMAHHDTRTPAIYTDGVVDVVENVIYNQHTTLSHVYDRFDTVNVNYIQNYFENGPQTERATPNISDGNENGWAVGPYQVFLDGNINIGTPAYSGSRESDAQPETDITDATLDGFVVGSRIGVAAAYRPPLAADAFAAKTAVLADCGALLPKQDALDAQVIADIQAGTSFGLPTAGIMLDDPADLAGISGVNADGWPDLTT